MWEKPFQRSCLATLVEVDSKNDSFSLYGLNSIEGSQQKAQQNQEKIPIKRKLFCYLNNSIDAPNRLFIRSHSKVKLASNWYTIQFSPSPLRKIKRGSKRVTRQLVKEPSRYSYFSDPFDRLNAAVKKHYYFFNRKISKML